MNYSINHDFKYLKRLLVLLNCCVLFSGVLSAQSSSSFYAYHTERSASGTFGIYSDLVVNLPDGPFIFERSQSFRPYWLSTANVVPYLGPSNPDVDVEYSYARLISQSDQEIVVHWRYPTTTDKVAMGFETYVHELYTIRPNGAVTRIVKQGTGRIEDWNHNANQYTQEIQLASAGMTIVSTTNPTSLPRPLNAVSSNPVLGPVIGTPSHHWKFDEAIVNYNDSSTLEAIANAACTINGYQANYKAGVSGTALAFDGYFSDVQLPASNATTVAGDITLEAWIAVGVNPHNMVPLVHQSNFGLHPNIGDGDDEKWTPFQGGQGYYLGINFEGQPAIIVSIGGTLHYCTAPAGTLSLGSWAHVVGVKSQDQLILYVNGVMINTVDVPNNNIATASTNVQMGLNNVYMRAADASPTGSPLTPEVNYFGLEGMMDEVRIHNVALTPTDVTASYNNYNPGTNISNNPPIQSRVLPGDVTNSTTFTAEYAKLPYHDLWDNMWQTSDYPDIKIKFENSPTSVIFWRGMNHGFALASENNIWNSSQSVENEVLGLSTYEHMMDKECRTAHVRIIEDTPARKLIHWRYAPRAADYGLYPSIGGNYWADEYYYIFPDQAIVRQVDWHGSPPLPFHDNNLILSPDSVVANLVNTTGAVQFANDNGQTSSVNYPTGGGPGITQASIKMMNTKSTYKTYNLYPANAFHHAINNFAGPFSHWPVAQVNSIGVGATTSDTNPRARSVSFGGNDGMGEGGAPFTCFWGMTNQPIDSLVNLRKSWNNAPPASNLIGLTNQGYDLLSRTYKFTRTTNNISFDIVASANQPLRNVCFQISNWGSNSVANLSVNGSPVTNFKQGTVRDTSGAIMLLLFYEIAVNSGTTSFSISAGGIQLNNKAFLQGPYSGQQMEDDLRSANLIPLTEPYTSLSGFTHINGGGETVTNTVLATTGNDAIVDWVFLELRNKAAASTVQHTRSALIQRDGDIVDVDGTSPVTFSVASPDDYFVAVRHRNHLGIRTSATVALSTTPANIDFTTSATATFGTNARVNLGSGVLGLWGGNANGNNSVRVTGPPAINDYSNLLNYLGTPTTIQTNVYVPQDFNMDGTVRITGPPAINDYSKLLNILGSPTTILFEQL